MKKKKLYDYKDICLIPRVVSDVSSRSEIDTSTMFCGIKLKIPLVASPMSDVCGKDLCLKLSELGGLGFSHRFQSINSQVSDVFSVLKVGQNIGAAVGINDDWLERFEELYSCGCRVFIIDVANGVSKRIGDAVEVLYSRHDNIMLVAGNVASVEGYKFLSEFRVVAVRCGIASGSSCSTKTETGIYSPMVSLISELAKYRNSIFDRDTPEVIADGGAKIPADVCKALALGSNVVMMGGVFAACKESLGKIINIDGKLKKVYRGAASYSNQIYEANKEPLYVEGSENLIDYTGSLEKTVNKFINGLKSSMSYFNSRNLEEYRKNVTWYVKG